MLPTVTWHDTGFAGGFYVKRIEALGYYYAFVNRWMARSPDGINWTWLNSGNPLAPSTTANWFDLAYDAVHGVLVLVGSDGTVGQCIMSADAGDTWGLPNSILPAHVGANRFRAMYVVALASGRLIAVPERVLAAMPQGAAKSDDGGVTWTGITLPAPYDGSAGTRFLYHIATDGVNVVVGFETNVPPGQPIVSQDGGNSWFLSVLPLTLHGVNPQMAAYWPGVGFYLMGEIYTETKSAVWFSADAGSTWSLAFPGTGLWPAPGAIDTEACSLTYAAASPPFLVTGDNSTPQLPASLDGSSWSAFTDALLTDYFYHVAYSPSLNRLVTIGGFTGEIFYGDLSAPTPPPPSGEVCCRDVWLSDHVVQDPCTHICPRIGV